MTLELVAHGDDRALSPSAVPTPREAPARAPFAQPRPRLYSQSGKRIFDIAFASAFLVVMAIPMAVTAIALRLSLGKGVLYRQARVGLDGKSFVVLKFRTMHDDRRAAPVGLLHNGLPDRRLTHKTTADPRHTRIGRILRATSLDEMPQLFNVIKGDMSVIGPRPELVHLVERMTPQQQGRHAVRPGLTGVWQVEARGRLALHEATDLDLDYIRHLSFKRDLSLLVRTPSALLRRTGS